MYDIVTNDHFQPNPMHVHLFYIAMVGFEWLGTKLCIVWISLKMLYSEVLAGDIADHLCLLCMVMLHVKICTFLVVNLDV